MTIFEIDSVYVHGRSVGAIVVSALKIEFRLGWTICYVITRR